MKILYVGYRDQRHSKYGGYDYIADYPDSDYLDASKLIFGNIPVGKKGKKLNLIVQFLYALFLQKKYDIVHYFYGDYILFKKYNQKRHAKLVTTIHMKAESLSENQKRILKSFDAVIVLSSSQKQYLLSQGINAHFIPHGFNAPDYKKNQFKNFDETIINIFYSGTNYRDFDKFVTVVKDMKETRDDIHFYAVGQKAKQKEILQKYSNVTICSYLNNDDYYSLLSSCDYNFLPLTFATANNALLEAQNMGVPSILPNIDGISDYADKDNNIYYTNTQDLSSIFGQIKKTNESENKSLIQFAERFSWKNVYTQLGNLYKFLLEKDK